MYRRRTGNRDDRREPAAIACDFEPDRFTTASWVAWFVVNFFGYFLITRLVIGVFKTISDIRNA
jgi:hypothetical protein